MAYIRSVKAHEILDSRGFPTIEVIMVSDQNLVAKASVPSGASTGSHEALELRDGDKERYFGKGVELAVQHVNGPIAQLLVGEHVFDQTHLDMMMITADGTPNKEHFGANAILSASLALARLGALTANLPLYRYIGGVHTYVLPCPMMNIINGGAHANNSLNFQEFMIRPVGAKSFKEGLRWGSEIFHTLKEILQKEGLSTAVGDEGGFAPNLQSDNQALELIIQAIEKAKYRPGKEVTIALDCAASEFYHRAEKKYLERTTDEHIDYLASLCSQFPIDSIEDGLDEEDWEGWKKLSQILGQKIQLVGDDLFVTNPDFLSRGIRQGIANSILIKPNQIGTLTETLETIKIAHTHGYTTVISHRSGETEDTLIADLAVAVNAGQIKTGSLSRTDRISKYNRLLAIELELGTVARFADSNPFSPSWSQSPSY